MVDIDHIVTDITAIEYNDRKAVALIEYKYYSNHIDLASANVAATEDLANRAGLPFFIVQYDPQDWELYVRPRNDAARLFLSKRAWMSEREYVCLLHQIRGKTAPAELLSTLNGDSQQDEWDVNWSPVNPNPTDDEIDEAVATILGEPWDDWGEELPSAE
ncbi:MAG: hypothetical protein EOP06_08255 [Proteobacteria bacterium]|nr:MAG: hypothetical protein EOP06_08255 [Pseudomonadota bacterium]